MNPRFQLLSGTFGVAAIHSLVRNSTLSRAAAGLFVHAPLFLAAVRGDHEVDG